MARAGLLEQERDLVAVIDVGGQPDRLGGRPAAGRDRAYVDQVVFANQQVAKPRFLGANGKPVGRINSISREKRGSLIFTSPGNRR